MGKQVVNAKQWLKKQTPLWVQGKENTTKAEALFKDLKEQTGLFSPLRACQSRLPLSDQNPPFQPYLEQVPSAYPLLLPDCSPRTAARPRRPAPTVIMEKTSHLLHRSPALLLSNTTPHHTKGKEDSSSSQPNHKIRFLWFLQERGSEKTKVENVLNGSGPKALSSATPNQCLAAASQELPHFL